MGMLWNNVSDEQLDELRKAELAKLTAMQFYTKDGCCRCRVRGILSYLRPDHSARSGLRDLSSSNPLADMDRDSL